MIDSEPRIIPDSEFRIYCADGEAARCAALPGFLATANGELIIILHSEFRFYCSDGEAARCAALPGFLATANGYDYIIVHPSSQNVTVLLCGARTPRHSPRMRLTDYISCIPHRKTLPFCSVGPARRGTRRESAYGALRTANGEQRTIPHSSFLIPHYKKSFPGFRATSLQPESRGFHF